MTRRRQFGSVRRLASGRWQVRYQDVTGRRHTAPQTFRTRAEAGGHLARVEADLSRGDWHDPKLGRTTLGEWETRWWPTTANLRPSTRARDRTYLDNYVLSAFETWPIGAITQPDVSRWVAELSARDLAPATVRKAYQLLGKMLGAAVDADLIASSACRRVSLPRIDNEEMRFLTPDEVARLAASIHPRYRALVLVGAYGGLRIGEMAGLRRTKVDPLHGTVEIADICVEVGGHLTFGPPKTRAGRRTLRLPRSVARELAAHIGSWAGDEFVFPAPEGGPLRTPAWRRRFWKPAVDAAGLAPFRPHDLRHTAVAFWIASGADPKLVSVRAGHTSVAFTLDRYGHLYPQADATLANRLDATFRAARKPKNASVQALKSRNRARASGT